MRGGVVGTKAVGDCIRLVPFPLHGPFAMASNLVAELKTRTPALLFQKLPNIRLAIPASEIKWLPHTGVLGVTELPVYL
jgi:hypothetical protein